MANTLHLSHQPQARVITRKPDGLVLHVTEYLSAPPTGRITLLLPFTAAHGRQLAPIARALAERGIHAVAIDLPGHGRSGGLRGTFTMAGLFLALESVVGYYRKRFPDATLLLGGTSWGGDLAILFTLWEALCERQTGRPRAVDAVAAHAVITPWQRELIAHFHAGLGFLHEPSGLAQDVVRATIGPRLPVRRMFRLDQVYHESLPRKRFASDPLALRAYDTDSYFHYLRYQPALGMEHFSVPLLLMMGEEDRLVSPRYGRQVYAQVASQHAKTDLAIIPRGSHAIFEEHTDESADRLSTWFTARKLTPSSAGLPTTKSVGAIPRTHVAP